MDLTKSAYAALKLYEVVPYLIETAHIWATGVVYFSAAFWKTLTNDEQAVLSVAAVEGARYFDALMVEDETSSMAQAAGAGGKVIEPEDRPAWEAGARRVWTALGPQVGGIDKIEAIAKTA
jgi:TRAP-type transport system periplasmic protein